MTAIDRALERLGRLFPKAIDLSLERIRALMHRLGDPQDHLPPVIHVAGTNGKGSTVAILRACCEAASLRTHAYTSPHLVRFNERIRVAGRIIADEPLLALLEEIERINDGRPITFFEITTAAAFLAFARMPADVVVLETGLGGILDATNVIAAPAVSVITPIAMDHMNWFGSDIRRIAAEKAGILKPGRPAVIGPQTPAPAAVLADAGLRVGAPLHRHGAEWTANPTRQGWRFDGLGRSWTLPLPSLVGRHQIANAGGAVAALALLPELAVGHEAIAAGLAAIEWPARLQRLRRGPLVALLSAGSELWLDGAHNVHAGRMLARQARAWRDLPLHLVFGALTTRAPETVLRPLASAVASVTGVGIAEAAAHPAEAIARAAAGLGIEAEAAASPAAAINAILAHGAGPVRILICGSLYLAGEILREHG